MRVMKDADTHFNLPHGLFTSLGRVLTSQWFLLAVVAIALLLTFRSVHNGLVADDIYHRSVLSGSERFGEQLRGPQAMMCFFTGDPERTQAGMDVGLWPWWTDPNIKAEFFQLIPTQTHILDYWLWPDRPSLMHVHSLVWFALVVFLAARFYRRILGPTWMAGVAALLFAIEDGHALPVGWIANRNTLIAACFGIGCLIAHDAWRRERKGWACWLALILWLASLCSKEAGIATSAYLFAYAAWMDESTLRKRFMTLVAYGLVLVVWRVVRDSLGYGVANLGFYVDPISDPGRFATSLLERYPVLMFGQWAGLSDLWLILEVLNPRFWWVAVGYVGFLGVLFWPLLRRDRIARFFATGMLLAVIPICATFPMDRLLMFAGLGAFGLLVRFWYAVIAAEGARPAFFMWRVVAVPVALLLVLLHIVAAPLLLTVRASAPFPRKFVDEISLAVPFDETIEQQDLVVVNPPIAQFMIYSLLDYEHRGRAPRALRTLAPGIAPMTVRRTDKRTLEVEPYYGYQLFGDPLFRNEQNSLRVGEQVPLARMTVTVLSVAYGRARNVSFRFETPLEDPSLRWLQFKRGKFVPWTPPLVGEEVRLDTEWSADLGW